MQGFILKITPMKNEDLIIKILTQHSLRDFYRFYGARHSVINLGYKIDFEEKSNAHFLPQARSIMHLCNSWERYIERVLAWQKFIQLLARHLEDVSQIDEFYFHILDDVARRLSRQNPLRALLEAYAKILKFEGRMRLDDECFLCAKGFETHLDSEISLARAFLPVHTHCMGSEIFNRNKILQFLQTAQTIHLSDSEVQNLWHILCLGM